MREKQFSLSRHQCDDMWRHYKQTDDRRIAERLHAILLLDAGQNAQSVCTWIKRTASMLLKTNSGRNSLNVRCICRPIRRT